MKNILLIATGGTIASSKTDEGLVPAVDVEGLLQYIPQIRNVCNLKGVSIMSIDSTNMTPSLMQKIAQTVADNYALYDGFVVAHGTDTMAYSAAAVTYMLNNLRKPVVFTGSQIPMEEMHTDAKNNLSDAISFACENVCGVYVVFDGVVINGTHAMKVKTRGMDAFKSINFPEIATIKYGKIEYNRLLQLDEHYNDFMCKEDSICKCNELIADTKMCEDIMLLKMFPGMRGDIFDYIKEHFRGVIIESFGIGGIPNADNDIAKKIQELIEAGVAVVVTTQCIYEDVDLNIYEVGCNLAKKNVIVSQDMTTEAVTMKLMWALAHYDKLSDIKAYIEKPYFSDKGYCIFK